MRTKVILTWSGGKDSALALHELLKTDKHEVSTLLTTVTEDYNRISMHGVRQSMLNLQAESLALPLKTVFISKNISNEGYGSKMRDVLEKYREDGVSYVVFGDIFLEDVRRYREDNLSKIGMKGIFPLWKKDTTKLAHTFIDLGFEAIITCIDSHVLDKAFVGRVFDREFLTDLPFSVDPCGENGEFHSFVYDGPIFKDRILYKTGDIILRENRFYYCDLIPL